MYMYNHQMNDMLQIRLYDRYTPLHEENGQNLKQLFRTEYVRACWVLIEIKKEKYLLTMSVSASLCCKIQNTIWTFVCLTLLLMSVTIILLIKNYQTIMTIKHFNQNTLHFYVQRKLIGGPYVLRGWSRVLTLIDRDTKILFHRNK